MFFVLNRVNLPFYHLLTHLLLIPLLVKVLQLKALIDFMCFGKNTIGIDTVHIEVTQPSFYFFD